MPSIALNTSDELRVYDNILETIGNTPLVRFNRVGAVHHARYMQRSNILIQEVQ
jgi:hypothetical protein